MAKAENGPNAARAEATTDPAAVRREVAVWPEEFQEPPAEDKYSATGETTIEEEIFYAAYLEATEGKDMFFEP